ncbi:MAG: family transcriptional regulator, cyclic receptor protein [Chloroflexota bacterium]|jgi:CRP-like cAMP-binding protein|nr:family transcriptional regulator, cyclic receptor protein [Chloroflexota bacterium]
MAGSVLRNGGFVDIWAEARDAGMRPLPQRLALDRGECLRPAGPDDWLYQVCSGRVRLSRLTAAGRKLDLDTVAAPAFFFGARLAHAMAQAVDASALLVLSRGQFETLLTRPGLGSLAVGMVESFGHRLVDTEERLEYLAYHSVPERLALALLRLRNEENGIVDGITHQELGDMVGAARETVTKVLHGFQARGYIQVAHRRVKVDRPTALAAMLDL